MRYYETEHDCIDCFREEYAFLSNFYHARLCFDGLTYFNSEAAYQAQKCADSSEKSKFVRLSGDEAKRLGGKVVQRADWEQVKLTLMEKIVRAKFVQNPYLAEYLIETGDKPLKEGNRWGDLYWGVDIKTGAGENHLGRILMEIRSEFREKGIPVPNIVPERLMYASVNGISAVLDDITQSDCECIVNAVHGRLSDAVSTDASIRLAAGRELMEKCKLLNDRAVGEASITEGFRLKAKYIIHTEGPKYGTANAEALLKQTYRNVFALAKESNIRSIAVPAVSVGKYSYPKKSGTQLAVETAAEWLRENCDYALKIEFVCTDFGVYELFCENIEKL